MWAIVRGVTVAAIVAELAVYLINPVHGFRVPRSVRRARLADPARARRRRAPARAHDPRAAGAARPRRPRTRGAVVGAGDAGQLIVSEMQRNRALGYTPIGLVDDDPRKKNLRCTASACSARRRICRS